MSSVTLRNVNFSDITTRYKPAELDKVPPDIMQVIDAQVPIEITHLSSSNPGMHILTGNPGTVPLNSSNGHGNGESHGTRLPAITPIGLEGVKDRVRQVLAAHYLEARRTAEEGDLIANWRHSQREQARRQSNARPR